jgi:dTDP-glucose 4,6-dehydratase
MPNKRVLITGAAGFLGSHLCDRFIAEGYDVIGMDNLITGDLANIQHLFKLKAFEFYNHDVSKYIHVSGPIDYILHFASPASPIDYLKIPIQTLKVGSLGIHNCLGLARVKKARVLIASTSEVYGDPLVHPQTEDYWGHVNPIGFRSCYDEGKRVAETLMMDYHNQYKVDIRLARIFNTYGPRMTKNDGRVVSNFITQSLENKNLTIYGDGSQTRSFCFVDDLIQGILKLFFAENIHVPINLGNPDSVSILQLANEVIQQTNSNSKVVFLDLPPDDPKIRQPNIERAINLLNWKPTTMRAEGINRTIEYFQSI